MKNSIYAKLIGKVGFKDIGEVPNGHIMPFDNYLQRFVLTFETSNPKIPIYQVKYYYDDIFNSKNWQVYKDDKLINE